MVHVSQDGQAEASMVTRHRMRCSGRRSIAIGMVIFLSVVWSGPMAVAGNETHGDVDLALSSVLRQSGFTGKIESTLESRLGGAIDSRLADLGRLLFFDTLTGLHDDNTCAGCHAPATGFGTLNRSPLAFRTMVSSGRTVSVHAISVGHPR